MSISHAKLFQAFISTEYTQSCGPLAHSHLPRSRPLTTEGAKGAKGSDGLWGINMAEKEQTQSVSPVY